ncbi:MAG: inorganic diphosphatase [Clostridiales bacterium]|jgi:inorganic pyrophosphatase|nr:inorganic diphosphatase [Clostridiales bacterium]
MNIWHDIKKERIAEDRFLAVIEIPKGGKKKYELDKETGLLILDRILYTSTHYPANYGFIPRTLAEDGDPLDVLVLCSESLEGLTTVECYPIGAVRMTDGADSDDKLIAIPFKDPTWNFYKDIGELPPHILDEIMHFFSVYKQLEHTDTGNLKILSKDDARQIMRASIVAYDKRFVIEN